MEITATSIEELIWGRATHATLATFERAVIIDALQTSRGNMAATARLLDTTERILGLRVKNITLLPSFIEQGR